jgi:histidinol phosphatase-like PHP family hydrolase
MELDSTSPLALAQAYIGGLAHRHTRLSNHPHHRESDLTVKSLLRRLESAGLCGGPGAPFSYVMINEHSSNPDRPRQLGALSLRARRLMRQRRHDVVNGVPVLHGLEVSLLPSGQTDLTTRLARRCATVIASRHRLPVELERDPASITRMLMGACHDGNIDVLGHPMRYIEQVAGVDWPQIFAEAKVTGTAVEVNTNLFWKDELSKEGLAFWEQWLTSLGRSGAMVFIGMDVHNAVQTDYLIGMWRGLERGEKNGLALLVGLLQKANITPERIVTSSYQNVRRWITIDKSARSQVF